MNKIAIGTTALLVGAAAASADIRITEYMYGATNGGSSTGVNFEFFEITNFGAAPVDLTGWSIDDNSRVPGSQSLTGLGILAIGESAVITEATDAAFRARWGLAASVKVLGGNVNNFSRADEMNVYDASNVLIDRLTYDDQTQAGTTRTQGVSAWRYRSLGGGVYGNADATWVKSVVGDAQTSWKAISPANADDVGSPGVYVAPAPGSIALIGLAGLVAGRRRRA